MIDLADPGATVVLPSGSYACLVLTKPLTLVGDDPMPTFEELVLAGPGTGSLALVNLRTVSPSGGNAPITGGGFSEIHIFDCDLTGPIRISGARCLEVSRSSLSQSDSVGPFLEARGATTSLLDVVITPLKPPLQNLGPDVRTARLGLSNASIPGRVEAKVVRQFTNDLVLSGTPHPGGQLDLTWTTPAPSVAVLVSTGTRLPAQRASGIWFLDTDAQIIAVEVSPGGMSVPIPADAHLLGQPIAFQVYDWVPPLGLSRPVSAIIH